MSTLMKTSVSYVKDILKAHHGWGKDQCIYWKELTRKLARELPEYKLEICWNISRYIYLGL